MSGKTIAQSITQTMLYHGTREERKRLQKLARSLDLNKIPKQITIPTEYMVKGVK